YLARHATHRLNQSQAILIQTTGAAEAHIGQPRHTRASDIMGETIVAEQPEEMCGGDSEKAITRIAMAGEWRVSDVQRNVAKHNTQVRGGNAWCALRIAFLSSVGVKRARGMPKGGKNVSAPASDQRSCPLDIGLTQRQVCAQTSHLHGRCSACRCTSKIAQ